MKTAAQQANDTLIMACLPLRFLFHPKQRRVSRAQMPGLKDSATFYRLWVILSSGLQDPSVREHMTADEREALDLFLCCYDRLLWEPVLELPDISQLRDDDLSSLQAPGSALYDLLRQRQRLPLWRRLVLKLQGW